MEVKLPKEVTTVTPLSKAVAVVVLIAVGLIGFAFGIRYQEIINIIEQQKDNITLPINRSPTPPPPPVAQVTKEEKQKIDLWIVRNNFNQYGDPKDTVYTGGTPLFNEAAGETIDRYGYIVKKRPDKPWNK